MKEVLFRLEAGTKEHQETVSDKQKRFLEYKNKLIKDGEKIVSEEQIKHPRFGNCIKLTLDE